MTLPEMLKPRKMKQILSYFPHFLWNSSQEVFSMTSELLELGVKNRTSEGVSHVSVDHWLGSSNYCSGKTISATRGPPICCGELLSYRSEPEVD